MLCMQVLPFCAPSSRAMADTCSSSLGRGLGLHLHVVSWAGKRGFCDRNPLAKVAELCVLPARTSAGSVKAYFKGNGTNVLKIAPETSIKLGLNDYLKRVVPQVRQAAAAGSRCGLHAVLWPLPGAVRPVCISSFVQLQ